MKVFPAAIAMSIMTLFGSPTNGQTVSSQGKGFVTAEQNSPIVGDDGYLQEALGIESSGGTFRTVLLSGCAVPCSAAFAFTNEQDNQTTLEIRLFRGLSNRVSEDFHIGDFDVVGITPAPRGKALLDIRFSVSNRNIQLSAIDKRTGETLVIRPTPFKRKDQPPSSPAGTPAKLDYPIGIVTLADPFSVLIESGNKLPAFFSDTFENALDNQRTVEVSLAQRRPGGVERMAVVGIDDLPPAPKGSLRITITLVM